MKRLYAYCLALAPVVLVVTAVFTGFFDRQEMAAYDWLMRTRPVQTTSPQIVIIEIADDTLKALGRWPLSRNFHGALIDALTDSGCKSIVFDIMLSEPGESDALLSAALKRSGKVYLPVAFRIRQKSSAGQKNPVADEMLAGVAGTLKDSVAGIGHINISVDSDGKVRRAPAWIRYGNTSWPSLGLLVAARERGLGADDIAKIPTDAAGRIWVNYPGPWTETFAHYSYVDVLKAAAARQQGTESWLDLSVFKDKICFVGLTAAGTSDFRANPIDPVYPMIGTQASICNSVLRTAFIRRAPAPIRAALTIAIAVFVLLICSAAAPVAAFVFCVLFAGIYTAVAWALFASLSIFPDIFLPLACIVIVYAAVLLRKFFEEAQKRRILEKELEIAASIQRSFLPADVRRIGSVDIRAYLKAARYVGGDLYDVIYLDDNAFGVFIGDVSGKGVSAALIMAQAISLLRVLSRSSRDPGAVLYALNNQLKPFLNGRFVTGQYLVVHAKEGFWEGACAGHPSFFVVNNRIEGLDETLPASGPPLGLVENVGYTTVKRPIVAGDKIFMYTDGWTEARNAAGREFGVPALKEIVARDRGKNIDEVLSGLQSRMDAFEAGAKQYDDLTAVILEF
ncbi:MAG: CHASE2 domain-containing protein [Candidatus Omnitrophota bacterium]